jgi:hypothetical protein
MSMKHEHAGTGPAVAACSGPAQKKKALQIEPQGAKQAG